MKITCTVAAFVLFFAMSSVHAQQGSFFQNMVLRVQNGERSQSASLIAQARSATTTKAAAAATQPPGHQPSMEEALTDLLKIPLDKSVEWYREQCNKQPHVRTLCDPGFRASQADDLKAIQEAKILGITLKMPFIVTKKGADYEVGDPFTIEPSGLRKQLEALKVVSAGGAADAAADLAVQQQAAAVAAQNALAVAAAAKAAADAKVAADSAAAAKAAQDKAAADAAAAQAAGDAAAAKAAADAKAKADAEAAAAAAAQQAAVAAAAKAAADKAAADKAAADAAAAAAAAEAAKPKIRRVGQFLQAPNGRTLYFMRGETPNSIICTGPCRPFWPLASGTWGIDPSAGCTGGSFVRADGDVQLQCGNRPLYMFRDDTGPNQRNGLSNPDFALA